MEQLTELQIWLVVIAATTLVWIIKQAFVLFPKWTPKEGVLSWFVYGVSYLLAVYFAGYQLPVLPVFGGPVEFVPQLLSWITDVLTGVGTIAGLAFLVYNTLWKKVLEGLKGGVKTVTKRLTQ